MAGFATSGSDDEVISGINVTPLVDVVLVLLIIFLITAPALYQSAIKVQLPKAQSGEQAEKSALNFTVTKEGGLLWNGAAADWDTLPSRLAKLGAQAADQTVVVSADAATAHGTVIHLMDVLRQAGIVRFALNVENSGSKRQ